MEDEELFRVLILARLMLLVNILQHYSALNLPIPSMLLSH